MTLQALVAVALSVFVTFAHAAAWEMVGPVVYVDDGDTVVLLDPARTRTKIRLASIDAPESDHDKKQKGRIGQPWSRASKNALATMVKGKSVRAWCYERDRYERAVCDLFVAGTNVNMAMVAAGMAWANNSYGGRYLRDSAYLEAETQARSLGRGLWVDPNPVPPWEWRKRCWRDGICN